MKKLTEMTITELNAEIERTEQYLWDLRERRMEMAVVLIQERNKAKT